MLLTAVNVLSPVILPTHEPSLKLTVQSPHFTYKVTTYRNNYNNRCALLRCGAETIKRFEHHTACDLVFMQVMTSSTNRSARLCPVDYIYSQWDTLSRTYNEGFVFLSDSIALSISPSILPLDPDAVHFSGARNHFDLSAAWLSVWPSNNTRMVFQAWNNAIKHIPPRHDAPEYASLNRARSCRAPDIVCHSRASAIAWQCDTSHRQDRSCLSKPYVHGILSTLLTAFGLVLITICLLTTLGTVLPRFHVSSRLQREAFVSLPMIPTLFVIMIVVLAGEHWIVIVRTFARLVGVKFTHALETAHLSDADMYRAVPDLRGIYIRYSYIFRDGNDMVRVSGPWVSVVVNLTAMVLFIKRVLYDGLLVCCLFWIIAVRLMCDAILAVAGRSKRHSVGVEDDEYLHRRSEIPATVQARTRARTFLSVRERDSIGDGDGKVR